MSEVTLGELVGRLPAGHLARKEYAVLAEKAERCNLMPDLGKLTAEIERLTQQRDVLQGVVEAIDGDGLRALLCVIMSPEDISGQRMYKRGREAIEDTLAALDTLEKGQGHIELDSSSDPEGGS